MKLVVPVVPSGAFGYGSLFKKIPTALPPKKKKAVLKKVFRHQRLLLKWYVFGATFHLDSVKQLFTSSLLSALF